MEKRKQRIFGIKIISLPSLKINTMRTISQKYFERLVKSADEIQSCGEWDYIILIKNGKERKFPISLWNEYTDRITQKYIRNKEKNFFNYY